MKKHMRDREVGGDRKRAPSVRRRQKEEEEGGGGGPRREEKGDDVKKRKLLWDKVSRSDASGPRTVSVKQSDTNKDTEENPDMHC